LNSAGEIVSTTGSGLSCMQHNFDKDIDGHHTACKLTDKICKCS